MQRCICGGCANGWPCGYDVCPICERHYTDSGYHVRSTRGTRSYPCGHPVISADKSRGAARSDRIRNQRHQGELAKLALWKGMQQS